MGTLHKARNGIPDPSIPLMVKTLGWCPRVEILVFLLSELLLGVVVQELQCQC